MTVPKRALIKVLPVPTSKSWPTTVNQVQPGDAVLLIIEDDPHYARVLLGLAREKGFKGSGLADAATWPFRSAREFTPTAISLDIFLPDMLGWTVLSHLKSDPATRHIPVQIVTIEEERRHGLERGAFAYPEQDGRRPRNWVRPSSACTHSPSARPSGCWWWMTMRRSAIAWWNCWAAMTWRSSPPAPGWRRGS